MSLASFVDSLLHPHPADPALRDAIEHVVDVVDPLLRSVGGYARQLEDPVRAALAHANGLAGALPAPIGIGAASFAADPLVHALFATARDIDDMLGESQAVRDFLAEPESHACETFHALLAARRCVKRVLGVAMVGDQVRSDVPQELLYFTSHTLAEPDLSLDATRARIARSSFDSIALSFRTHVDALRMERRTLEGERSTERAHAITLRGRNEPPRYVVQTRRIETLEAGLRAASQSLTPAQLLRALADTLASPATAVRLDPVVVAVDRSGIMSAPDTPGAPDAARLEFSEFVGRDQRRNVVLLVEVQRERAAAAVAAVDDRRRRFLVI